MATPYWVIEDCEECFGAGLNPDNPDDICSRCRGYAEVPMRISGLALLGSSDDYRDKYRTRNQAIAHIDPFYVKETA